MVTTVPGRSSLGSGQMFDRIAHRYDLLNRVMSFGVDRYWRKRTVAALALEPGSRVLDLATGTADLALEIAAARPGARIVGVDPSENMLDRGREKIHDRGYDSTIELVVGDAQRLDFADGSFDAGCMAFGIRNVPDRAAALREMVRVLEPGGRMAILELSEPRAGWLSGLGRFYIHRVVPRIGALLSGALEYRYLQQSIEAFPPAAEFSALMSECGFVSVAFRPMTFGVVTLFVGTTAASPRSRSAGDQA